MCITPIHLAFLKDLLAAAKHDDCIPKPLCEIKYHPFEVPLYTYAYRAMRSCILHYDKQSLFFKS